jgi:hypothetical protein
MYTSFAAAIDRDAVKVSGRVHNHVGLGIGAVVPVKFENGFFAGPSEGREAQD